MLPLSGIIFSRHILYECVQKSPFHLDCMGFNLILLLIKKKKRCSIFNNRKASLHRTQWLRLNWRLCIPFAVLESIHIQIKTDITGPYCIAMCNFALYTQSKHAMQSYSFMILKRKTFLIHFLFHSVFKLLKAILT